MHPSKDSPRGSYFNGEKLHKVDVKMSKKRRTIFFALVNERRTPDFLFDVKTSNKRRTADITSTFLRHNFVEKKTYVSKLSLKFDAKPLYRLLN